MKILKIACLLLCLLFENPIQAQTYQILDSLNRLYQKAEPGYDQIDYIIGISRSLMFLDQFVEMDSVLKVGEEIAIAHRDSAGYSNILVMQNMGENFYKGNVDKALELCQKAVDMAEASGDKDALTFALYNLAEAYAFDKRDYYKALDILDYALSQVDETVTRKNLGNTYKNLGNAHYRLGNFQEAIDNFEKAIDNFKIVAFDPDPHFKLGRLSAMYADGGFNNIAQATTYLAEAYQDFGNLDKAESLLLENLAFTSQYDNKDLIAWVQCKLGALYKLKTDYTKAVQYLQVGIKGFEAIGKIRDVMDQRQFLGDVFYELEEYDQALQSYQQSAYYVIEKKDTIRWINILTKQANAALASGKSQLSKEALEQASRLAAGFQDPLQIMEVLKVQSRQDRSEGKLESALSKLFQVKSIANEVNNKAIASEAFFEIAQTYELMEKSDSVVHYGELGLELANTVGRNELLGKTAGLLSKAYEKQGAYEASLKYFKFYQAYQDSIASTAAQEIIRQEQVRQNIQGFKDQQELAELRSAALANRNQQYLFLAFGLLSILLIGGYLFYQLRQTKAILEKQNQELIDLNQTKDRFFGIIAHDIRSPIVALDGVGQQMNHHLKKGNTEKLQKLSDFIDRTSGRLSALLDNLLNWALVQTNRLPYNPEEMDVVPLVKRTLRLFEHLAEVKGIQLQDKLPDHQSLLVDESGFQTILRNLISNALKFTPKGGKVEIGLAKHNGSVAISVSDTGVGIEADKIAKLFSLDKKSRRGTDGEKGTGLGLILCKELVGMHGGEIDLKSEVGKGSIITFSIPNKQA